MDCCAVSMYTVYSSRIVAASLGYIGLAMSLSRRLAGWLRGLCIGGKEAMAIPARVCHAQEHFRGRGSV